MIRFELNGELVELECQPTARLLDILREYFGLTGPKEGCGEGECGACSVIMNGKLVNSCLIAAGSLQDAKVMTIEGYSKTKRFEIVDKAFAKAGAVQCGFCTPGMIMATEALLSVTPHPTMEEIRQGIAGNICRCTGYNMIIEAINLAANEGDGLW